MLLSLERNQGAKAKSKKTTVQCKIKIRAWEFWRPSSTMQGSVLEYFKPCSLTVISGEPGSQAHFGLLGCGSVGESPRKTCLNHSSASKEVKVRPCALAGTLHDWLSVGVAG